MDAIPDTCASLLVRLSDPRDERAWAEFTEIYAPLVRRLARQRGMQDADAEDLRKKFIALSPKPWNAECLTRCAARFAVGSFALPAI